MCLKSCFCEVGNSLNLSVSERLFLFNCKLIISVFIFFSVNSDFMSWKFCDIFIRHKDFEGLVSHM
jgi:hypothetical protein